MLNHAATPELDRFFHAMADPTRRRMVERLTRSPATVSELAEPFDISLPAVLQHLQVLETSGVVRTEKVGRVRVCRFEPTVMRAAERWMIARRTDWESRLDRLGEFLKGDDVHTEPDETS